MNITYTLLAIVLVLVVVGAMIILVYSRRSRS